MMKVYEGMPCGGFMCCDEDASLKCSGGYCRSTDDPPKSTGTGTVGQPVPAKCDCTQYLQRFTNVLGYSCMEAWSTSPSCTTQCLAGSVAGTYYCPMFDFGTVPCPSASCSAATPCFNPDFFSCVAKDAATGMCAPTLHHCHVFSTADSGGIGVVCEGAGASNGKTLVREIRDAEGRDMATNEPRSLCNRVCLDDPDFVWGRVCHVDGRKIQTCITAAPPRTKAEFVAKFACEKDCAYVCCRPAVARPCMDNPLLSCCYNQASVAAIDASATIVCMSNFGEDRNILESSYGGPMGLDKEGWRDVCKIKCNHPSSSNQCVVQDSGIGLIAWSDSGSSSGSSTGTTATATATATATVGLKECTSTAGCAGVALAGLSPECFAVGTSYPILTGGCPKDHVCVCRDGNDGGVIATTLSALLEVACLTRSGGVRVFVVQVRVLF